jgi:GT2 family glycosyltransferase/glycosyltransferase involved in cell wall biosynthesis
MEVKNVVCYSNSLNVQDAMAHLRIIGPFRQAGINIINGAGNGKPVSQRVSDGDIVIIQREFPKQYGDYQEIVNAARREGKPIVFDLDDLLFFLPEDHPDRQSQYYASSLLPMFQALTEADLVTVSTPNLQTVLASYNDHVVVLPNYFDDTLWQLRPPVIKPKGEKLTIGFMGGNSHGPDIEYVLPVLLDLIKRYPGRISFHFWGMQPPAEMLTMPMVEWTPPYSYLYKDFSAFFQTQFADIFVAPLAVSLFNRCKSALKFFEYTALGAPSVLSRLEAYTDVVTHGHNGLLASSPDEWTDCLIQLIEDNELRFRLATNAQSSVRKDWFLSQNAFRWQDAFKSLAGGSPRKPQIQERVVRSINLQLTEAFVKKDTQITEKEQAVQALSGHLAEQDSKIQALSYQVTKKDSKIQALSYQVTEQGSEIQALSTKLTEQDSEIQTVTYQLDEKEHALQTLSGQLSENVQAVQALSGQMAERDAQVQVLSSQLAEKNQALEVTSFQLNEILRSKAWRLMLILRNIRVSLIPPLGRREIILRKVFAGGRKIKNAISSVTRKFGHTVKESKIAKILEDGHTIQAIKKLAEKNGVIGSKLISETPLVSIIIPVHNKIELTLDCILSIVSGASGIAYEIIVMDDASNDRTAVVFKFNKIKGLRYFRNVANKGFVISCNEAAKKAKGKYLIFLNNDTKVHSGWIENLLSTFTIFPNAGMAGSKLIFPNGKLQEAGGVIASDGSAENYGRDDDPQNYLYNYVREVDYVSGACIMLPKSLWESVGGFENQYQPAYYEDVDLAYKLRQAGYQVFYQPFSQITHFEGGTNGKELSDGVKRYQVINQKRFFETWKNTIADNGTLAQTPAYIKSNRYGKGQVLYIDLGTPKPDHYAGDVLSEAYIVTLREAGYAVTFLPYLDLRYTNEYTETLQKKGVECVYSPYVTSAEQYITQNGHRFDFVVISRVDAADKIIDLVKEFAPKAKIIFSTIDLHFMRLLRAAQLSGKDEDLAYATKAQEIEINVIQKADCTLVVSDVEKQLLVRLVPDARVMVVPFPTDLHEPQRKFAERQDIVFLGGFMHKPNVDAVLFFADEIWPLISPVFPEARFIIAGADAPKEICNLASYTIVVKGFVEDLAQFYEFAKLSVAPLRYGAGIKGKILTSLGHGVPCVATNIAAEGIGLVDGTNIQIANTPKEFADKVVKVFTSAELWSALSKNGQDWIRENYSRQVVSSRLLDVFKKIEIPQETTSIAKEEAPAKEITINAFEDIYKSLFSVASNQDNQCYVPLSKSGFLLKEAPVKLVAFYLPQFHPIPENDEWWGRGFTEWTNVSKAIPQFMGHYQPHLPGELGFYDLRNPDILIRQVELAQIYGVYGFAFYYYWFNGKRLLEKPIDRFHADKKIDFPYCIIWANENWTRRWDGKENEVLISQEHTPENDFNFIKDIKHFLKDKRYIRIDGKPVLLVYRVQLLQNPADTAERWRQYCRAEGIGEIYLMAGQVYGFEDPRETGFDAAFEFPPHNVPFQSIRNSVRILNPAYDGHILRYQDLVDYYSRRITDFPYELFKTVSPGWDNEPRKPGKGVTFAFSTPELYRQWLMSACNYTLRKEKEKRFVFINAWNEWAEGAYLEPDRRFGYAYLQETRKALYELASSLDRVKK